MKLTRIINDIEDTKTALAAAAKVGLELERTLLQTRLFNLEKYKKELEGGNKKCLIKG